MEIQFIASKKRTGNSSWFVIIPKPIGDAMENKLYVFHIKEVDNNETTNDKVDSGSNQPGALQEPKGNDPSV